MRIAVVVPYVWRVHGNRLAFSLARGLAASHEVTVYVEALQDRINDEVRNQLAPASLRFLRTTRAEGVTNWQLLVRQLARGGDRRISKALRHDHEASRYDWIVNFANEGHWIGSYVSAWEGRTRPRTGLVMMDPIDQVFLLARERPNRRLRELLMPLYPILHQIEAHRIQQFDRLFSISGWVSQLCTFLYGITPAASLAAVDGDLFQPSPRVDTANPYIAVPTVSVGPEEEKTLRFLFDDGLPLVTYGPRAVQGIPHRGFLPEVELVPFLQGARVTLFVFDYEGLGLVPLESLAVGTPVVTQPKGGPLAELSGNRFVRFAGDPLSMSNQCKSLLEEPKTSNLASEVRSTVSDYFAPTVAARWARYLES